jgi:hypothetical protein
MVAARPPTTSCTNRQLDRQVAGDIGPYLPSNAGDAIFALTPASGILSPAAGLAVFAGWAGAGRSRLRPDRHARAGRLRRRPAPCRATARRRLRGNRRTPPCRLHESSGQHGWRFLPGKRPVAAHCGRSLWGSRPTRVRLSSFRSCSQRGSGCAVIRLTSSPLRMPVITNRGRRRSVLRNG